MQNPVQVPCPSCGAKNRVPAARLGDRPRCGRCKTPLLEGGPIELDAARFARFVEVSDLPVVVDFWADWCGPCRAMAPHFERAARELAGRAILGKLDTEAEPDVAGRLAITSLPTMALFEGGREVARASGSMSAAQILDWFAQQRAQSGGRA